MTIWVWAVPLSLATTYGITIVFSSSGYLDVSVPRVTLTPITWCHVFNMAGCPIRTSADQCSFAAPRSFSQLTTSFVASESLGIHHAPLFASFPLFHIPVSFLILEFEIKPFALFSLSILVNERSGIYPYKEIRIFPIYILIKTIKVENLEVLGGYILF